MLRFAWTRWEETVPTRPPVRTSTVAWGPLRSSRQQDAALVGGELADDAGVRRVARLVVADVAGASQQVLARGVERVSGSSSTGAAGETVSMVSATTRMTGLCEAAVRMPSTWSPTRARVMAPAATRTSSTSSAAFSGCSGHVELRGGWR